MYLTWHESIETAVGALLLAVVFLIGDFRPFKGALRETDSAISLFGGMSAAYVFVRMMPELATARADYVMFGRIRVFSGGIGIYFTALLGFIVFYALHRRRAHGRGKAAESQVRAEFRLRVGELTAYVWMITYLLANNRQQSLAEISLYTLAMAAHFFTIEQSVHKEYRDLYRKFGQFILAGAALLGWATGAFLPMPRGIVDQLVAFLSGAIIMNSALMEMPAKEEAHFIWFIAGGVIYGLLLMQL
jgi:hypothetical protein